MVAKELKDFADELEKAEDFEPAVIALVKRVFHDHRRIIFNGDGYAPAWEKEAEKRGLLNLKSAPDALPYMASKKNIALMEEFGVLTKTELESRCEVSLEQYSKLLHIEAVTMLEIARKRIVPAINAFMTDTAAAITAKQAACPGISCRAETKLLQEMSLHSDSISDELEALNAAVEEAEAQNGTLAIAQAYHDKVKAAMEALRSASDKAEAICGDEYWPLPSYSSMLYYTM